MSSRCGTCRRTATRRRGPGSVTRAALLAGTVLFLGAAPCDAQVGGNARHISVTWTGAPIRDVLSAFAVLSGKSIVAGPNVTGFVTADINDQPWDVVMGTILVAHGLIAVEDEYGIISVRTMADLLSLEVVEPIVTRVYRTAFVTASELQATIAPLLSERGSLSSVASSNMLVVSDIARVQVAIAALLR